MLSMFRRSYSSFPVRSYSEVKFTDNIPVELDQKQKERIVIANSKVRLQIILDKLDKLDKKLSEEIQALNESSEPPTPGK